MIISTNTVNFHSWTRESFAILLSLTQRRLRHSHMGDIGVLNTSVSKPATFSLDFTCSLCRILGLAAHTLKGTQSRSLYSGYPFAHVQQMLFCLVCIRPRPLQALRFTRCPFTLSYRWRGENKTKPLHLPIKKLQCLLQTNSMTEADFLLKRLFLAPLDFLSPFRPIASWPPGCHPEILIDCPSGFTFHFSLAFLGFSSIFPGFLFHLAEVYSRSYYCFAETALCGNTNVLICMLARCGPEISFPSNRRS